jgi:DNA (cytosine-5)-methyltransferase 1
MSRLTHGSLFSGIGGFDLAAKWMGWENVFHVEQDPFCRQVLTHHFPEAQAFKDVQKFDTTNFRGRVSVISGGFPCQPFSNAGNRKGTKDVRYLWPEMFRVITEIRPRFVVAENVRGLCVWNNGEVLSRVCDDLEGAGYEVCPVLLGANAIGAPHERKRIFIVAYANGSNTDSNERTNTKETGEVWRKAARDVFRASISARRVTQPNQDRNRWETFPNFNPICGGHDGLSQGLDGIAFPKWRSKGIKAYGNAVVPQLAYEIFKMIDTGTDE